MIELKIYVREERGNEIIIPRSSSAQPGLFLSNFSIEFLLRVSLFNKISFDYPRRMEWSLREDKKCLIDF